MCKKLSILYKEEDSEVEGGVDHTWSFTALAEEPEEATRGGSGGGVWGSLWSLGNQVS